MTTTAFWRAVAARLAAGERVFVAMVVANTRGSPGTLGARLLLDGQGRVEGTIGGGIMELNVLAAGRAALAGESCPPRIQRLVHRKNGEPEASGLICAGEQTNLSMVLSPEADAAIVARFVAALEKQDTAAATLYIDPQGLRLAEAAPDPEAAPLRLVAAGGQWHYAEESVRRRRLAIVGGGHCGRALASLAATVGYAVDVFDIRSTVLEDCDWADEVTRHALADYGELPDRINWLPLTYVVVMTTAVTQDIDALTALAPLRCPWLGVMGSRAKIRVIRQALLERGVARADLDAITAPVGLPTKSDTPPEIAVSIMAQLLAYEQKGRPASERLLSDASNGAMDA